MSSSPYGTAAIGGPSPAPTVTATHVVMGKPVYTEPAKEGSGRTKVYGPLALRVGNLLAFVATLVLNGLASTGVFGKNIGALSDEYHTLFTPAGWAFSIWGLIYSCEAIFVVRQLMPQTPEAHTLFFSQVGVLHLVACAVNSLWIVVFTHGTPPAIMLASIPLFSLMATLILVMMRANLFNKRRSNWVDYIGVDFFFSVYAGWTTVASTVNVCAGLVGYGWTGTPWTAEGWSVLLEVVATGITFATVITRNNPAYALPVAWALLAIGSANACPGASCHHSVQLGAVLCAGATAVLAAVVTARKVRDACRAPKGGASAGDMEQNLVQ